MASDFAAKIVRPICSEYIDIIHDVADQIRRDSFLVACHYPPQPGDLRDPEFRNGRVRASLLRRAIERMLEDGVIQHAKISENQLITFELNPSFVWESFNKLPRSDNAWIRSARVDRHPRNDVMAALDQLRLFLSMENPWTEHLATQMQWYYSVIKQGKDSANGSKVRNPGNIGPSPIAGELAQAISTIIRHFKRHPSKESPFLSTEPINLDETKTAAPAQLAKRKRTGSFHGHFAEELRLPPLKLSRSMCVDGIYNSQNNNETAMSAAARERPQLQQPRKRSDACTLSGESEPSSPVEIYFPISHSRTASAKIDLHENEVTRGKAGLLRLEGPSMILSSGQVLREKPSSILRQETGQQRLHPKVALKVICGNDEWCKCDQCSSPAMLRHREAPIHDIITTDPMVNASVSMIKTQGDRIMKLENELRGKQQPDSAYRGFVEDRFQKLEAQLDQVQQDAKIRLESSDKKVKRAEEGMAASKTVIEAQGSQIRALERELEREKQHSKALHDITIQHFQRLDSQLVQVKQDARDSEKASDILVEKLEKEIKIWAEMLLIQSKRLTRELGEQDDKIYDLEVKCAGVGKG